MLLRLFVIFIISKNFIRVQSDRDDSSPFPPPTEEHSSGIHEASDYQFPFMVSIRRTEYENMNRSIHICAGALIDNETVVTAAHCLFDMFENYLGNPNSFMVVAGGRNINDKKSALIKRTAKRIFVYAAYSKDRQEDDVAIIIIDQKLDLNGRNLTSIPLSTSPRRIGEQCTVLGWNSYNASKVSPEILQFYTVQIYNQTFCVKSYSEQERYIGPNELCACRAKTDQGLCNTGNLCASGKNSSAEQKDAGDPSGILVCNEEIAGVLVYDNKCFSSNRPQIFTDVVKYGKFIDDVTNYLPPMNVLVMIRSVDENDGNPSNGRLSATVIMLSLIFILIE